MPNIFELSMYMFANKLGGINYQLIEERKTKDKDEVFLGLRIYIHELSGELQALTNEMVVSKTQKRPLDGNLINSKITRLGYFLDQLRETPNLVDKWFPLAPKSMGEQELNKILEEVKEEAQRMWPNLMVLIIKGKAEHPSQGFIYADHNIRHILRNLVFNAAQFSPEEGVVTIYVEYGERSSPYLKISVTDEGPGINEDELDDLFTPGKTCRKGGSGLGLYIAWQIARGYNGDLRYVINDLPGSHFMVLIPYYTEVNNEGY